MKVHLSKERSRDIKRMSRKEMENYLQEFYAEAYSSGVHKGAEIMKELLLDTLSDTPGIGEKRANQILEVFNEKLNALTTAAAN